MKRTKGAAAPGPDAPWLLLIHQLPSRPAYLRVKVWRRLQGLGAIALKNSVYVLPALDHTREDFGWVLREIEREGGEGVVCGAHLLDGMADQQVRALFDAARDAEYTSILKDLRKLGSAAKRSAKRSSAAPPPDGELVKMRRRFAEVAEKDFFSATGRLAVEALLTELEARQAAAAAQGVRVEPTSKVSEDLSGRTWVTRQDVHVDRIACAWLIRRFIDKEARFKFVSAKNYEPDAAELRFDMFQAEFTHEGDRCSFEVMLERFGLDDPALSAIGEIVHDIDLKDGKFGREETPGIAHVIAGLCSGFGDDMTRIERGCALLDDMYASFRRRRRR
jgi:hypothetical protein